VSLYLSGDKRRFVTEPAAAEPRSEFQRDYGRVIHCASFRRLQGKTQLFPGHESDFFRNRLTHSLEVGQIAESIARELNHRHAYFRLNPISERICMTAALLHDIGHPPFGHNGEEALDERMRPFGGFEGNAQTLRIVTQIEKKKRRPEIACPLLQRAGLNLSYRTVASILKYDQLLPESREVIGEKVRKGFYFEDAPVVLDIKSAVAPDWDPLCGEFKTIECSIMDIADDIAYSTYDLEDSLKAGFLTPTKILTSDVELLDSVAKIVAKRTDDSSFDAKRVLEIFATMFSERIEDSSFEELRRTDGSNLEVLAQSLSLIEQLDSVSTSGEMRTTLSSDLVGRFVRAVDVEVNEKFPQLSRVFVDKNIKQEIETIKTYTYEAVIASSRVKLAEYRGKEVVGGIFDALVGKNGQSLLPPDIARLFKAADGNEQKRKRVISDFIAGMTDRYALEFFGRLHSDSPQTIFKEA
jgi:dGTPase